jgi:hypothetical protein
VIIVLGGTFDRFWLFTVRYAQEYGSIQSMGKGADALFLFVDQILREFPLLWGLVLVSIGGVFLKRKHLIFLFGFILYSFLAVCPGLYFRPPLFYFTVPFSCHNFRDRNFKYSGIYSGKIPDGNSFNGCNVSGNDL